MFGEQTLAHLRTGLTSTETMTLIRVGECGGRGVEVGEEGDYYTYRYTVTSFITMGRMGVILMFH